MVKECVRISVLVGGLSLACLSATAQEVVHALVGTVNGVDAKAKTITILTDDGSSGTFKDMTDDHAAIEFDKDIRSESTAADEFNKKSGARVIVYYYGYGDLPHRSCLAEPRGRPIHQEQRNGGQVPTWAAPAYRSRTRRDPSTNSGSPTTPLPKLDRVRQKVSSSIRVRAITYA